MWVYLKSIIFKLKMDPLSVPMKYKFNTRIGNWNEEQELEEHKYNLKWKDAGLFKKEGVERFGIFKNGEKVRPLFAKSADF